MQMICGRLLYIRLPPFCPTMRQDAQSRRFPSLCPASLVLRGASLLAEMLPAVSLPLSHFFFLILRQRVDPVGTVVY